MVDYRPLDRKAVHLNADHHRLPLGRIISNCYYYYSSHDLA